MSAELKPQVAAGASSRQDPDADVLALVTQLQTERPGWTRAIVTLAISLVLFVGAGVIGWSWEFVVQLIPVLLFHELGHYVAMRVFKYRNVQMFFIPFFGAAVSGKHYNVPGWKKVVVSLAGPLPGILVGILLGIVSIALGLDWLRSFSLLMLILNGFNLLPILPFDGGWVVHATLFCRHPWLDLAFRIVALAGLAGLALVSQEPVLAFICVPLLITLPATWRLQRVAAKLREEGVGKPLGTGTATKQDRDEDEASEPIFDAIDVPAEPVSTEPTSAEALNEQVDDVDVVESERPDDARHAIPVADDQAIPEITARQILAEVRRIYPPQFNDRLLAQIVLQIFEILNARPPHWAVSVGLLAVHAASFGLAALMTLVLAVSRQFP